jgi:hypothetical protein
VKCNENALTGVMNDPGGKRRLTGGAGIFTVFTLLLTLIGLTIFTSMMN